MKGEGSKKKERSKVWRNKGSLWRSTLISLGSPLTHTGVHAHTHAHMHALKHAHMHTHNPYKYAPRTHHTHFSCPSWGGVKKIFSFLVTPHTPTSTHIQRVLLRWVLIRSKGGGLLVISKQNKQNRRTQKKCVHECVCVTVRMCVCALPMSHLHIHTCTDIFRKQIGNKNNVTFSEDYKCQLLLICSVYRSATNGYHVFMCLLPMYVTLLL